MHKQEKLINELTLILNESSTEYLKKHWKDEYYTIVGDKFIWKLGFINLLELHGVKILKYIPRELWMKGYILIFILTYLPIKEHKELFEEYGLEFLMHPKLLKTIISTSPLYLTYLDKDNFFKTKDVVIELLSDSIIK